MVALQGGDDEVVDRHPDGAAPVGVAAVEPRRALARRVADLVRLALHHHAGRMIRVVLGQRTDAKGGQELGLVQHAREHAGQALAPHQGKQRVIGAVLVPPARHQRGELGTVGEQPVQARVELRQLLAIGLVQQLHGK